MHFEQAGELGRIRRRQKVAASSDRLETALRNDLGQDFGNAHHRRVAIAAAHDERRTSICWYAYNGGSKGVPDDQSRMLAGVVLMT